MFLSTKPILYVWKYLNNALIFNFSQILLSLSPLLNQIPAFQVCIPPSICTSFSSRTPGMDLFPVQTLRDHQTEQPPPIDRKSPLATKNVNYSIFQDSVLSSARSVTSTSDRIWLLPSSTRGKHQRPLFADAVGRIWSIIKKPKGFQKVGRKGKEGKSNSKILIWEWGGNAVLYIPIFLNSSFTNNTVLLLRHSLGMDDLELGSLESGGCSHPKDLTQSGVLLMFYWKRQGEFMCWVNTAQEFPVRSLSSPAWESISGLPWIRESSLS